MEIVGETVALLYKADPNAAPLRENPRQAALEAKKMRLAERNSLIQKGRAKAATLPSPRKEKLQSAADRLHPNTVATYGGTRSDADSLIHAYQVENEVLSTLQNPTVNVAVAPVGTIIRYVRQLNPVSLYNAANGRKNLNLQPVWVYDAVGTAHNLPAVGASGNALSLFNAGPVRRHRMDHVVNGIEKQKKDDVGEISTALDQD